MLLERRWAMTCALYRFLGGVDRPVFRNLSFRTPVEYDFNYAYRPYVPDGSDGSGGSGGGDPTFPNAGPPGPPRRLRLMPVP